MENRVTILSDLSANLFAALLLILILLLQAKIVHPRGLAEPRPQPQTVEVTSDLGAIPHAPLSGTQLIDLLRGRADRADGLGLDLLANGVTISGSKAADRPGQALEGATLPGSLEQVLVSIAPGIPVRVYVFDNRWYRAVSQVLAERRMPFIELSVPLALRSDAAEGEWSDAFRRLVESAISADQFRDGLAHILAGSAKRLAPAGRSVPTEQGGAAGTPGSASASAAFDVRGLLHTVYLALAMGLIVLGVGFVVAVRRIVVEPALRYSLTELPLLSGRAREIWR